MNPSKNRNELRPLVSFILTYHNSPIDVVGSCLESIAALSLRPNEREIIVVDGGSDESLIDRLTDYRDSITYIRIKEIERSVARNIGLRMATGTYIQFIDGGDRLASEAYEMCLDIVRYNAPDMVMFKTAEKDIPLAASQTPEPVDGAKHIMMGDVDAAATGYIFNRRILMDLRFTPGRFYADEEFTPLLVLRAEKLYATEITAYRHEENMEPNDETRDKKLILSRLNDMEYVLFRLNEIVPSIPRREQLALRRYVTQLTMRYIKDTMLITRASKQLDERLERLKSRGLFPLPERNYTTRYSIFRMLANNRFTRKIMAAVWK